MRGIEWHLVPAGGQYFNGQTERNIGILKRQMQRSLEGKKYMHEVTCTLLQEAPHIVNSRPIVGGLWAEGEPFSPKDFLMGRTLAGIRSVKLETVLQVVKRSE
jgi:hypothetical protein